jgi:hypothetical protein
VNQWNQSQCQIDFFGPNQTYVFSKRNVLAAKQARELSKRYPSQQDLETILRKGIINDVPMSVHDARRAYQIFGPEVATIKGKPKLTTPTKVTVEALPKHVFTELVMHMDVMFVDKSSKVKRKTGQRKHVKKR